MFLLVGVASADLQLFSSGMLPQQRVPVNAPVIAGPVEIPMMQQAVQPDSGYWGASAAVLTGVAAGAAAVALRARAPAPEMMEDELDVMELAGPISRRSVMAGSLGALAAIPFAASADDTEDAMVAIARRNAERQAAEKEAAKKKYQPTEKDLKAEQDKNKNLILGIAGVGTLASGAFIIPNLTRLATKISSGGQDSGYGTEKDNDFRRKQSSGGRGGRGGRGAPKAKAKPQKKGLFG